MFDTESSNIGSPEYEMENEIHRLKNEVECLRIELSSTARIDDIRISRYEAAVDAIKLFAVWKNGVQWVNDMRTLEEVIKILKKEYAIEQ